MTEMLCIVTVSLLTELYMPLIQKTMPISFPSSVLL